MGLARAKPFGRQIFARPLPGSPTNAGEVVASIGVVSRAHGDAKIYSPPIETTRKIEPGPHCADGAWCRAKRRRTRKAARAIRRHDSADRNQLISQFHLGVDARDAEQLFVLSCSLAKPPVEIADVYVGDYSDAAMIRVYTRENAIQRGKTHRLPRPVAWLRSFGI
jgi:hypothetical protein